MQRDFTAQGIRRLFLIVVPIKDGYDLGDACRTADSISRNFFHSHKPSGDPGITGIWTSGMVERGRVEEVGRRPLPTLVYSGVVYNQLSIFEKPDEIVDALTAMLELVVPKINVDLERSSITVTYGDLEFHLNKDPMAA